MVNLFERFTEATVVKSTEGVPLIQSYNTCVCYEQVHKNFYVSLLKCYMF